MPGTAILDVKWIGIWDVATADVEMELQIRNMVQSGGGMRPWPGCRGIGWEWNPIADITAHRANKACRQATKNQEFERDALREFGDWRS